MHCASLAVTPDLALAAFIGFHPTVVTVELKAVLPNLPEIIIMYVPLMIVTAYAKAARYGTVIEDGCHVYSSHTTEKMVTGHALIRSQESFT